MKTNIIAGSIIAMTLLLPLAACSQSGHDGNSDTAQAAKEVQEQTSPSAIGAEIQKGIEQAKQELVTQDIDVTSIHIGKEPHDGEHPHNGSDTLPKAVITPQGNLVIAGKPVDATPEQHALLVDYRQQIIGIAMAGMDIGASSANMGVGMAKKAIVGALLGRSDKEIEASMKPQTDKIRAAAIQLCHHMPDVLASQQKLATALPAFQPYATMTQKDVDDCGKDTDENGKPGVAVFSE
ncbi:hypothetical protein DyAD56_22480 [Dyella sp. AD56]|uniref:hypothetical protein n=1 Tax=Dyella sp. AD56 TaxID=1528744 RepID=UPI000C818165|nr:hypothetical protein [Dyella sp. AD56]PMQ02805.1 hypothetical protein DyAD56_22480 [Dyella sp. AD56]